MSNVIDKYFEEVKTKYSEKISISASKSNFKFIGFKDKDNITLETIDENKYQFNVTFTDKSYYKKMKPLQVFKEFLDKFNFKIHSYHASRKGEIICPYNHKPFEVLPATIVGGENLYFDDGCKTCYEEYNTRRIKQDFQIFKDAVQKRNGTVLGNKYYTEASKILVKCNVCDHKWETCMTYLKDNGWCYPCGTGTTQSRKNFLEMIEKEGYKLISDYKVVLDKVKMICPKGHDVEKGVGHFLMGSRCRICQGLCPIEAEKQFIDVVNHRGGEIIEKYNGALTKINIQCENNHIFNMTPSNVKTGSWCNICIASSGESFIMRILDKLGIEYIYQDPVCFDGLERCRYDITCIYKGKKVIFEFDGKQHFKYIDYYHTSMRDFFERQDIDRQKFIKAIEDKNTRFIRVYYDMTKDFEFFEYFIEDSLDSEDQVIFSHPEHYKFLNDNVNLVKQYKEKIKEAENDTVEQENISSGIDYTKPYSIIKKEENEV
jgi:hypothetical protein